jgi:putative transposase
MPFDPARHHRRSIRLPDFDYSQAGAYFVTISVHQHLRCLGQVHDGKMRLSQAGLIVQRSWLDLPQHYTNVTLDVYCIMPDHFHGLVVLTDADSFPPGKQPGLQEIVRAFKSFSARRINALQGTAGIPFWQRNYFEHIVRNEEELVIIREYILSNPLRWQA